MLRAAVVVPLIRYESPALVLVRRAAHLRRNPGEMAFPGGLVDPGEDEPATTALREFEEELGLSRGRVRIVERLGDVVTRALSVTVTPFVGVLEPPVRFACDQREIASVHEVPLASVYVPGALYRGVESVERDGVRLSVPAWIFDVDGLHVWGATARILSVFVERYPTIASVPLAAQA